jgi:hypothetical protein
MQQKKERWQPTFETAEELLFKETSAGSKTEEPAATGARTTTRNSTQGDDILLDV